MTKASNMFLYFSFVLFNTYHTETQQLANSHKPKTKLIGDTMKYSEIKEVKDFCEGLHSEPEWREVVQCIVDGDDDFEVENVRFIKDDVILSVMVDEIFADNYTLGCFNASFIAENSDLNYELVQACQESEAYEAIGKALNDTLTNDEKEAFCEAYADADGYDHHFNGYNSSCEEVTIEGNLYHVFDKRQ